MSDLSRAQYTQIKNECREKYAYKSDAISVADLFAFVKKYDKGPQGSELCGQTNALYNKTKSGGMNYGSENTQEMGETGTDRGNNGIWQQGDDT